MRIINRNNTKSIDYSLKEYHRLQYNHYCNQLSNPLSHLLFDRPSGEKDLNGIEIYENDIVETTYHLHTQKDLKLTQIVKFKKGCFVLKPLVDDKELEFETTYTYTNLYVADKVEVIDNLHQNVNDFTISNCYH